MQKRQMLSTAKSLARTGPLYQPTTIRPFVQLHNSWIEPESSMPSCGFPLAPARKLSEKDKYIPLLLVLWALPGP